MIAALLATGCEPRPAKVQPATPGTGASAASGLQRGPSVGPGVWIEADVAAPGGGAWTLHLAYASEADSLVVEYAGAKTSLVETLAGERHVLAEAAAPKADAGSLHSVWARERDGRWTVWLGGRRALAAMTAEQLSSDTVARAGFSPGTEGAKLARLSVALPCDPAFFDDFMRDGPDDSWRSLAGEWEYAGVRFPERSANPFSLRARFPGREPKDPFLERRTKPGTCGIGATLSSWRGAVDVERITGNGPAAEAGLQEHDIVLAIGGRSERNTHRFRYFNDLEGPPGSEVKLEYLRPGELRPRTVTLERRPYRWAREDHGLALPREDRARNAKVRGRDSGKDRKATRALAAAGKSSWNEYRYEASVMCPGAGGVGLAFAVRDSGNFHVFRAVGDPRETGLAPGRLALVRVRSGTETVLTEREWALRPQTFYRMAVDLRGEKIRCFVDGAPALAATDADLPAGRVGVWALEGEGAFFDDVAVSTDRATTAPAPDTRAAAVFAGEQDMRRWANPADEWVPDPASDWWRNRFRFPGAVRLRLSGAARFEAFLAQLGARASTSTEAPCAEFALASTGAAVVRSGDPVEAARGRFARGEDVVLELDAKRLATLSQKGGEPISYRAFRSGDSVGIRGLENLNAPGAVEVTSDGVLDCFFRRAPVDWEVESGHWGVRNKWICDPRFSWYGGHSESLAAVWSKHSSGGDVTLDFYAALLMAMDDPPYERVGDFACTILAGTRSLASGYTFIVSGGRNSWSRLYGGGKLLAESRAPRDRLPSNVTDGPSRRELHQRWFRITLERVTLDGMRRVRALLDGREVFNIPDTLGRETGRCALWTQDNGMLVARARIAASVIPTKARELGRAEALVRQKLGGLTNHAFGGLWTRLEEDGQGPTGAPAIKVTNVKPGGAFAAASVRTCGPRDRLSFDFRAEEGAKVDLYFVPIQQRMDPGALPRLGPYRVRLTGPLGERERHPVLAGPLAKADGEWRRIEVDIGRLVDAWSAAREGPVRPIYGRVRPVLCNLEDGEGEDYLPAGFGGNDRGACYSVSGLRIEAPHEGDRSAPCVKRLLFPGEEGTRAGCVRIVFDDSAGKGRGPSGGSGIDTRGVIVSLRATPSERSGPRKSAAVGAGVRLPPSVADNHRALTTRAPVAAGTPVYLRAGHPATRFDPLKQELEVDLAMAGMPGGPHAAFEVGVMRLADVAGNAGAPRSRSWPGDGDTDTTGPVLTSFAFGPAIPGEVELDFEPGAATTAALRARTGPESPIASLDGGTSRDGSTSLRLTAHEVASPFNFAFRRGFADLDKLTRLSFDYRLPPRTPVNLVIPGRRSYHSVVFTDRGDPLSEWSRGIRCAGEFDEAVEDDTWRHAELDLAATFRRAYPRYTSFPATGISLADWGWRGLWPGDGCWIDNVRIEGARRGSDLSVSWRAFDLSGVADAAWVLDTSPGTVPEEYATEAPLADAAAARIPLPEAARLPDGPAWFHLRLRDAAGNWSRTFHKRVLLDNTPPVVMEVRPVDGSRSAAKDVVLRLDDLAGVVTTSLRLCVTISPLHAEGAGLAGARRQTYAVDGRTCRFDRGTGILRWSARAAGREGELVPGAKVTVELISASDIIGNTLAEPVRASWTCDPGSDIYAPPAPRLRFTTHTKVPGVRMTGHLEGPSFGDTNDFERELGPVEWTSACEVALSPDAARNGKAGARITVGPERRGEFVARLRQRYWFPDRRPYFRFHCRLPEGLERLALRLDFLRERRDLVLIGPGAVGGVSPPDASGWRTVAVDLGSAVQRWGIEFPEVDGEPYRLAAAIHLAGRAPPGSVIDVDDVELATSGWRGARVDIEVPEDAAGVDGLAIAWDCEPESVPPARVTHPLAAHFTSGTTYRWLPPGRERRGVWYLHVRARDGAGNWGPTSHLRVDFLGE